MHPETSTHSGTDLSAPTSTGASAGADTGIDTDVLPAADLDAELLLDHHLGDVPTTAVDGRETVVHLGRTSMTGVFDQPGEFDLPPEEPVLLVGEIPWELRGTDD